MKPALRTSLLSVLVAVALCASAESAVETEMTVVNASAGIYLGATLTMPADGQPRAAVVLASGSGAQNRDEEILGFRPFKAIADYLGGRGYAVLRMDDRGIGLSSGDPLKTTLDDYVSDLGAAFAVLDSLLGRELPKGVIGHSEGGNAAVKLASANPSCGFIVTLAAPAWPGDSIIMSQARAITEALAGTWEGEATQRHLLDMVKSDMSDMLLKNSIYYELAVLSGPSSYAPEVQSQLLRTASTMSSPSYRGLVRYNPAADIAGVAVPWLALNGDMDFQVLHANLEDIAALNPSATIVTMQRHNHLFQRCTTGLPTEYATLVEDISPETLETIADWLDALDGARNSR